MPIDLRDQYFGPEIEMPGITRERPAKVAAEMFGQEAEVPGIPGNLRLKW